MFSNLPNEILIPIFHQLHQDDQIECMRVCYHWNQVISSSTLYRTVFIYSLASMNKLIERIQQRPVIATQIERLIIRTYDEWDDVIVTDNSSLLLSLLPNLKILHCNTDVFTLHGEAKYPWCNQIQYIYEDADGSTFGHFLSFNVCPNLTTLRLEYVDNDFLSLVKNAPALTSLTIYSVSFNFAQLELIHKYLPHLQFFKINYLEHLDGSSLSADAITPATSMNEFVVTITTLPIYTSPRAKPVELLWYISRKYSNLSRLTYNIDEEEITTDNIKRITENGWIPLLQRLGPQLKKVCLFFPEYRDDFFEKMDQFSCKPHYLSLDGLSYGVLTQIAHSQQIMSIQTLDLKNTLCTSFDWLKDLCALKKLNLTYWVITTPSNKMHMTDILNHSPPTLETLAINTPNLIVDLDYAGISNIKSLSLTRITLSNNKNRHRVDSFLSRCFPRLTTLKLRNCDLQNDVLNLETLDLVRFQYFELEFNISRIMVLVHTLGNNEQRLYYINNIKYGKNKNASYNTFYPQKYVPVESIPANEVNGVPNFTLVCHSFNDLVFTGTNPLVDSYSAFADNNYGVITDLAKYLYQNFVDKVIIVGLALDYCIKFTCLDAVKFGFKTVLVREGTKPVDQSQTDSTLELLKEKGVTIVSENDLLLK